MLWQRVANEHMARARRLLYRIFMISSRMKRTTLLLQSLTAAHIVLLNARGVLRLDTNFSVRTARRCILVVAASAPTPGLADVPVASGCCDV